jgi:hypothetical protein
MNYIGCCDEEVYYQKFKLDNDFLYLSMCRQSQVQFFIDSDDLDYLCYLPLLF